MNPINIHTTNQTDVFTPADRSRASFQNLVL